MSGSRNTNATPGGAVRSRAPRGRLSRWRWSPRAGASAARVIAKLRCTFARSWPRSTSAARCARSGERVWVITAAYCGRSPRCRAVVSLGRPTPQPSARPCSASRTSGSTYPSSRCSTSTSAGRSPSSPAVGPARRGARGHGEAAAPRGLPGICGSGVQVLELGADVAMGYRRSLNLEEAARASFFTSLSGPPVTFPADRARAGRAGSAAPARPVPCRRSAVARGVAAPGPRA
jgi:hypothetical protein